MPISSTNRKAGPYLGNGSTAQFAFSFKVFAGSDLLVARVDTAGVETTLALTTDYTVSLNDDQDANPGGAVALPDALPVGYTLTIACRLPYLQQTDLANQGGFYPKVITNALDRLTIFAQQIAEQLGRALMLPVSDTSSGALPGKAVRASRYPYFDSAGDMVFVTGDPSQPLTHEVRIDTIDAGRDGATLLTVPSSYTPGAFDLSVFKNRAKLIIGVDYAETNPTHITTTDPVAEGDVFEYSIGDVLDVSVARSVSPSQYFTGVTGNVLNLTTISYTPEGGALAVFFNGSKIVDFDQTNSTTITLPFDLIASDEVEVIAGMVVDTLVAADDSISTAKLQNGAVTAGKLAGTLDLSAKALTLPPASVTAGNLVGTLDLSAKTVTLPNQSVSDGNLNLGANAQNVKNALNAAGAAPIFGCRAWCAFNGTGTPAILAAGNIASPIVDNGTGLYTFTFVTQMPDANYAIIPGGNGTSDAPGAGRQYISVRARTVNSVQLQFINEGGASADPSYASFVVFR